MANFSPQKTLSKKLSTIVDSNFRQMFDGRETALRETVLEAVDFAMMALGQADTPYHNSEHTFIVCLAGQDILHGKSELGDPISPADWASYVISLLFHDIGYLKKLFPRDNSDSVVAHFDGTLFPLPLGATDASLTRIHVDRGIAFVRDHFKNSHTIDVQRLMNNIESTRFPPPPEVRGTPRSRLSWPDMVRAADLIGQLADPNYLRKLPALYEEFLECGTAEVMGLKNYRGLLQQFPNFVSQMIQPLVVEGFAALGAAPNGKRWIESLNESIAYCEKLND
jgi:hypothetical protein